MGDNGGAPENWFGLTDPAELERIAGRLATQRLYELERSTPLTSFTRDDLAAVHAYLMQDIYPWAGQLRTTEVGAMGMAMCRAQYIDRELDQMLRHVGWAVDWTRVSAGQVHAARYVGAATVDSSYLAQALRSGVLPATEGSDSPPLSATEGRRDPRSAAEIFHDMMTFRRSRPRGTPYRPER